MNKYKPIIRAMPCDLMGRRLFRCQGWLDNGFELLTCFGRTVEEAYDMWVRGQVIYQDFT